MNEVAYMGDDIPDIEVLNDVRFAGCPRDAVQKVQRSVSSCHPGMAATAQSEHLLSTYLQHLFWHVSPTKVGLPR